MSNYNRLLKERALAYIDDLYRIDPTYGKSGEAIHRNEGLWFHWHLAVDNSNDMLTETLEALCVELACQFLAYTKRRPSHHPLLSAWTEREEAVAAEKATLEKIKRACVSDDEKEVG